MTAERPTERRRRNWQRRSRILGFLCVFFIIGVAGCGAEKVDMKKVDLMGGVNQADQDKIKGFLDKAGVKGDISSIEPTHDGWIVEVSAAAKTPGKRTAPIMPMGIRVLKDGKVVTKEQ